MDVFTARKTLKATADELSDCEIQTIISKLEFLAESFLDIQEKEIFQGKTLKQLLHNE